MIGTVTRTGAVDDVIDRLMMSPGGEVLAPPTARARAHAGGEYDYYRDHVTRRNLRRLCAAGLVSSHGMQADQLAHVAGWSGTADQFTAWYLAEALTGLDARAARRSGVAWADQAEPDPTSTVGELPGCVLEYLLRLIHPPKAEYAAAYAYHLTGVGPCPTDPGAPWAGKARARLTRMLGVAD